ncbi:TetR family transcriptional regulator [Georgenia sp. AZ-5]|uniref:TetR/AcrR family transcriptional regulator n=1 Tax=Georgenia sp. AZ-5 TaxID=3367526 RepID=UPI003753F372
MSDDHPAASTEERRSPSRDAVLVAARELFAERGYNKVTIRDVAAGAGLSPAMVMKCAGSKRELFYQAATLTPPPLPDVPDAELGATLVRQLVERTEAGAIEPLTRALILRLSGPDPDSVRQRFTVGYLDPLTERLGGDEQARLRAELVIAALAGLTVNLRIFEMPVSRERTEEVIRLYGALLQRLMAP